GVVGPPAHAPVYFGGDDHALATTAPLGKPSTDDLLGDALPGLPAVHVGGVEEVDAVFEGPVHDGEAVGLARVRAEVHGAEAEAAHLEPGASEMRVVHGSSIVERRSRW